MRTELIVDALNMAFANPAAGRRCDLPFGPLEPEQHTRALTTAPSPELTVSSFATLERCRMRYSSQQLASRPRTKPRTDSPGPESPEPEEHYARGVVKFFKRDKGYGGIRSPDAPGDIWVHMSAIDMEGFRSLEAGQEVECRYERADQDSWKYRATWVRPLPKDDDAEA